MEGEDDMSKQRNKRNTRRGRAKRWVVNRRGFRLRGTRVEVRSGWTWLPSRLGFGVFDKGRLFAGLTPWKFQFHNRAAAMRAAEHLARGR